MSNQCNQCGSYAINHHHHGRDGSDPDLCDVCYWHTRHDQLEVELAEVKDSMAYRTSLIGRTEKERNDLKAELARVHRVKDNYSALIMDAQQELAALKAKAVIPEKARDALARRCLWIAYVWNDHNFLGAYKYAREEAESHGITGFDEANEWLEAQPGSAKEDEQ